MNVHVWGISSLFESFNILKAQGTPGALKRILQPEFDQKMVNEFFHEFEILKAYTASVIIGTLSQILAGFQDLQLTKELVHQEIPVAPLARKNPCRQRYCSSHWSRRLRFPGSDRREAIWLQATAPWRKKTQTAKNSQGHTIPGRLFNLLNPTAVTETLESLLQRSKCHDVFKDTCFLIIFQVWNSCMWSEHIFGLYELFHIFSLMPTRASTLKGASR